MFDDVMPLAALIFVGICRPVSEFVYKVVNKRSDTDLGNTTSAPRGGERAT